MISIENLSFRFQDSPRYALRDVNLRIEQGEFVVIAGPSGCGKSTLALAIGGYLFRQFAGETTGTVTVAGLDVRRTPVYDVADIVGLVQQNPEAQFCTLTVQDEVAFGLENRRLPPEKIRRRMTWALEIVGSSHLVDRALATLSGGEKQKVAIAAMMATKPRVLIFDEPTSSLDPPATAEIFEVISHILAQAGITVIVIEHKVDFLRAFEPRLVSLENGRIVYDGPLAAGWQTGKLPGQQTAASMERPAHDTQGPESVEPVVAVEGLHLGYDGNPVLRDVSLEVFSGEFVAVMGDNGSGKTTFLQSLLGLIRPNRGQVKVLGKDTRQASVSDLARQVGFVFQNPDHQLFAESVWKEATFALHNFGAFDGAARLRTEGLLTRCGLDDRRQDHPYRLSYGEKRRLNLVSILAYAPRLILLDEVLIGQDAGNATFLLELLREQVTRGSTVIMANHDPQVTSRYASRLIFFNDGSAIVDAPVHEAFQQLRSLGYRAYLPGAV
jgi:energy-coupling factor transporter ATP-binding protein EcfA2